MELLKMIEIQNASVPLLASDDDARNPLSHVLHVLLGPIRLPIKKLQVRRLLFGE